MWTVEIIYNINRAHRTWLVHTLDEVLELVMMVTMENKYDGYFASDITNIHIDRVNIDE